MDEAAFLLIALAVGLGTWLVYELATGQRELVRFLAEMAVVYGPLGVILAGAAALDLFVILAVAPWMIFLLAGGRGMITRWLAAKIPDSPRRSSSAPPIASSREGARWEWTEDPRIRDPSFFKDWFDRAVVKDGNGFYSEHLSVGPDGRVDPTRRIDGTIPMLPMFFHQVSVSAEGVSKRGPTTEEFRQLVATLQAQLEDFEFVIDEDPERRWIRYRVRR